MKLIFLLSVVLVLNLFAVSKDLDFSNSVIITPGKLSRLEQKAVQVLQEEINKRTGIGLETAEEIPGNLKPVIMIGQQKILKKSGMPLAGLINTEPSDKREGFQLVITEQPQPLIIVAGNDPRGVFYGVGRLLRILQLKENSIVAPESENIVTAPKYPIRGHQLGYRPKTNAYDAWDADQFDQYIRELAIFGANSIEIMPPHTDDDPASVHMQIPPMEMMIRQAEICDDYDLDVWIWYPNMGSDYTHPDSIADELKERDEIFRRLKRIDKLFVPGGDPGDLHPDILFDWIKKVALVLHKYHPQAKIWISPQAFRPVKTWLEAFYRNVNMKYDWFGGVVFGPWVKTPLAEMRKIVDPAIMIRRYPDITHCISSQYPVRNWDLAYAMTHGRESFNHRPLAEKQIHNALDQYADGSLSYSEGINDDVNKFIWSGQDWDPDTPVIETLREYCRLLVHPDIAEDMAQSILALERNWEGPLLVNPSIERTLSQWQEMEKNNPAEVTKNYRFQMGLLRAYYDAYIKVRLINETALEMKAYQILKNAKQIGSAQALNMAENFLKLKTSEPPATKYRDRCWEIADRLYAKIGSQTSVNRYKAHPGRGDFMDYIDRPLNDAVWLLWQIEKIRELREEEKRLSAIHQILERTNPGPGGFYDNLGTSDRPSQLGPYPSWEEDPGSLLSPRVSFGVGLQGEEWIHTVEAKGFDGSATPLAWMNQVTTLYDTPLTLVYADLDPLSQYSLKVAYTGRFRSKIQLKADDRYPIHELIQTGTVPIMEFPIPSAATEDGILKLTWTCGEGERGSQIAEVWLIRDK
jgi:hypothetical protein